MPNGGFMHRLVFGVALLCSGLLTSLGVAMAQGTGNIEIWTDDTLSHKIEAKFVGINGPNVVLQKADGQQLNVPYAKLSLSSQFKAKKLSNPSAFDAPPLPSSYAPPALAESPFPEDPTIDEFLDTLYGNLKAGKADIAWYALPKQARADVEAIVTKGADVLGPKIFKQLQAVLPNLLVIVRDKRSFIVGNTTIAQQPEVAKQLNQILPAVEPMIELLTKTNTWNSENFKEGNVGPWLMSFSNDALKATKKMTSSLKAVLPPNVQIGDLESLSYKVLEKTADSAKVEYTIGKGPKVVTVYKKMDGIWLSDSDQKQMAMLPEIKSFLDNLDQAKIDEIRNQVRTVLTVAGMTMNSLANAKTQQEFNSIIDPYIGMAQQAVRAQMARGGGMGGPGMSGPGMGGMTPGMGKNMSMSGMGNTAGPEVNSGGIQ